MSDEGTCAGSAFGVPDSSPPYGVGGWVAGPANPRFATMWATRNEYARIVR